MESAFVPVRKLSEEGCRLDDVEVNDIDGEKDISGIKHEVPDVYDTDSDLDSPLSIGSQARNVPSWYPCDGQI